MLLCRREQRQLRCDGKKASTLCFGNCPATPAILSCWTVRTQTRAVQDSVNANVALRNTIMGFVKMFLNKEMIRPFMVR